MKEWCEHIKIILFEMEPWTNISPDIKRDFVTHNLFVDPVNIGKIIQVPPTWMYCPVCGTEKPNGGKNVESVRNP